MDQLLTEHNGVLAVFQNERNDETVWADLYQKAVDLATDVGVQPSVPRNVGRQRNRPNAPADTPSTFWRVNMYLPFMDHLTTELSDRLLQANDRYLAQRLIPAQVSLIAYCKTFKHTVETRSFARIKGDSAL